jgi:20S proteasome alpha/beta subunit
MAGQAQHELTRTGGARPLGITALVVGIDPPSEDNALGRPQLYQTDPGGIVEECSYCAAGKGRDAVMKVLGPLVTEKEKSSSDTNIYELAADMTRVVLSQLEDDQKDQPVEVWTIQPHAHRRGGMHATCIRNVTLDTIESIRGDE